MHAQSVKLLNLLSEAKKNKPGAIEEFYQELWPTAPSVETAEWRDSVQMMYDFIEPKKSVQQKHFCLASLSLAFLAFNDGNFEQALQQSFIAQKLFEEINDDDGKNACSTLTGSIYRTLGEVELAVKYVLEAFRKLSESGAYLIFRVFGSYMLAEIYLETNQLAEALSYYKISEKLCEEVGNKGMTARVLTGLGVLYLRQKKYSLALDYLNHSLELCDEKGNMIVKARTLTEIGNYYTDTDDYETAVGFQQQALAIREELNIPNAQITNLIQLGDIYRRQGKLEDAIAILGKALRIAEDLKVKPKIFHIHSMLADIYQAKSDSPKCLFHFKAFHRIREEVQHEDNEKKIKNLHLIFAAEQTQKENSIIKSQKAEIERKNAQLQRTVDELTRTRVSRKAKAITLVVAVFLFLLEEVVLHFTEGIYTQNNFILSLSIKGVILISLKPIENFIEGFLLRKIMREHIEI